MKTLHLKGKVFLIHVQPIDPGKVLKGIKMQKHTFCYLLSLRSFLICFPSISQETLLSSRTDTNPSILTASNAGGVGKTLSLLKLNAVKLVSFLLPGWYVMIGSSHVFLMKLLGKICKFRDGTQPSTKSV